MIGKTMLFNPFTGAPRHPDDIKSDPAGVLVWDGEEPLRAALSAALPQEPADPMDWPLPCDVTVGHGTMRKGVRLGTLVQRMKVLYEMATGENADAVANRTPEERQVLFDKFQQKIAAAPTPPAEAVPHSQENDHGR